MAFTLGSALPILGGLVGGFTGGQKLPKEARQMYQLQLDLANRLKNFGLSAPLSDPGEQAALAQQRGMLGEEQRQAQDALGTALQANPGAGNLGDALTNMRSQFTGQRMAVANDALLQALLRRQGSLLDASRIGQAALQAGTVPKEGGQDFSGIFQNLGYLTALGRARKQMGGPVGAGKGGVPVSPQGGYGLWGRGFPAAQQAPAQTAGFNAPEIVDTVGGVGATAPGYPTLPEYARKLRGLG